LICLVSRLEQLVVSRIANYHFSYQRTNHVVQPRCLSSFLKRDVYRPIHSLEELTYVTAVGPDVRLHHLLTLTIMNTSHDVCAVYVQCYILVSVHRGSPSVISFGFLTKTPQR